MEKVMNKTQLVDVVAKAAGMKKKEAEVAVEAVFDAIADALADGDKVQIIGFGTFEAKEQAEREGRNPLTGEKITIAACKRPAFAASQALKDKVNA
jgi:DNA-binding protein HU-beta